MSGTESTCVTILEATVHLVEEPKSLTLVIFDYPDIAARTEHVLKLLEFKFVKEKGDQNAAVDLLPEGDGFLLLEFGGTSKQDADAAARRCIDAMMAEATPPASAKLFDDPVKEEMVWKMREGGLGSTAWVPNMPGTWEGFEDSAVPVEKMAPYLRDFRVLLDRWGYHATLYGHQEKLKAAHFTAIGSLERLPLAWFDWLAKAYVPIEIDEQVEVCTLAGDIALKEGTPEVHAHVNVSERDGTAHGGRLKSAVVRPTLELVLTETPAHLKQTFDGASGLALIDLSR